jgi:hypothetical protein
MAAELHVKEDHVAAKDLDQPLVLQHLTSSRLSHASQQHQLITCMCHIQVLLMNFGNSHVLRVPSISLHLHFPFLQLSHHSEPLNDKYVDI